MQRGGSLPEPMEGINRRNATRRFSMGIHRNQEGHFCDEVWEDWTGLTRKALTRKCPPARLLVTLFDIPKNMVSHSVPEKLKDVATGHPNPEQQNEPDAKCFSFQEP